MSAAEGAVWLWLAALLGLHGSRRSCLFSVNARLQELCPNKSQRT